MPAYFCPDVSLSVIRAPNILFHLHFTKTLAHPYEHLHAASNVISKETTKVPVSVKTPDAQVHDPAYKFDVRLFLYRPPVLNGLRAASSSDVHCTAGEIPFRALVLKIRLGKGP